MGLAKEGAGGQESMRACLKGEAYLEKQRDPGLSLGVKNPQGWSQELGVPKQLFPASRSSFLQGNIKDMAGKARDKRGGRPESVVGESDTRGHQMLGQGGRRGCIDH